MQQSTREQSEQAIVGTMLAWPKEAIPILVEKGVSDLWFTDSGLRVIYAAARAIFTKGELETHDTIAICQEAMKLAASDEWKYGEKLTEQEREKRKPKRDGGFMEWPNWLDKVTEMMDGATTVYQIEWHINNLLGYVMKGKFLETIAKATKAFETSPQEALAILGDCASSCWEGLVGSKNVDKAKICKELEDNEYMSWHMRVDPYNENKDLNWVPGLKLPFEKQTRLHLGLGGRLHIVAARPSVGKTSWAINLIRYWADTGVRVVVNSLDMPPEDMIDRMRAEKSRVSFKKKMFTPTEKDLEKLKEASKWVVESPVEVTEELYVEDFCADVTMRKRRGAIDVVIVDYVQLLYSYAVDNANEYQRVSFVAEYLKRTANRFKIPIIALCQLNRTSTKGDEKEPTLADLRGSGALEQAASSVVVLHRDGVVTEKWRKEPPYWYYADREYGRRHAAGKMDAIWYILLKNQNGPTGKLPFVVNKPYFVWKLGDLEAEANVEEKGYGAAATKVEDNRMKFARISRDWRKDSWEKELEGQLCPFMVPGVGSVEVLIEEKGERK